MADETGQDASISALFGGGEEAASAAPPPDDGQGRLETPPETPADPTPPSVPGRPEWAPEAFWRAKEGAPGAGEVDIQGMAKSWTDTKAALTRAQQELAEARKQPDDLAESVDAYLERLDLAGLTERHPRAIAASGGEKAKENPSIEGFMRVAQKHGIGVKQAHAMMDDYLGEVNGHLPEPPKSAKEQIAAAVAAQGPNGAHIARDVQAWLAARARAEAFTEPQLAELGKMVRSGAGLSTLYSLMRAAQSSGPPAAEGTIRVDSSHEADALRKMMADRSAVQMNLGEIKRRWEALNGKSVPLQAGQDVPGGEGRII